MSNLHGLKTHNRTTTYWSLKAFELMLYTRDKEQFRQLYSIAAHDNNGGSCWNLMKRLDEKEEHQKARLQTEV